MLTRDAQKWKRIEPRDSPDYANENLEMMIAANAVSADEEEDMSDNKEAQSERQQEEQVEQDAPGLSTRVSARATKGKKPIRYGIDEDENM